MLISTIMAAVLLQTSNQAPQTAPAPVAEAEVAQQQTETTLKAAEEADLDRVVCRSEVVVGTRFNSRTCMTRRAWNQRRDESRRLAQRIESANGRRDFRAPASASGR